MQTVKIKMQNEKLKKIRQAKHLEYGSFDANMNNIGRAWSSLLGLNKDLPGHVVANMYVIAKLIRTQGGFKQDTYDDAANYLYQAELMQKETEEPEVEPDEEDLALARRKEVIDRVEANRKAATKAIYNVK